MISLKQPLALLGGLTPEQFMRDYWQRKPLLIRQAMPGFTHSLSLRDIRELVKREEVESRMIWHDDKGWHMKQGPLSRLPSASKPNWTVLAQSVDLHDDNTAALMHQFRFIADARLDDVMISIASQGGGVGPHFDSYDVFLLQAHGRRHWRISQQADLTLEPGLPLKILKNFAPDEEYVLEPGDMLYLPPHVAHDGIALDDCMTISVGFRAPTLATLACGMLEAANDQIMANLGDTGGLYALPVLPGPVLSQTYKDPGTSATNQPARVPDGLVDATLKAVRKVRFNQALASRFLGQWITEPSAAALFEPNDGPIDLVDAMPCTGVLKLDRCSRMAYRGKALFINGEVAAVPASAPLRRLADDRSLNLALATAHKLAGDEREMLSMWLEEGWLHYIPTID
jgi:50S ribosomal protein L16 3-hydroxylase